MPDLSFKQFSDDAVLVEVFKPEHLEEELSNAERIKRKNRMKRLKNKMKRMRDRRMKQAATKDRIDNRSQKRARSAMAKKLKPGKDRKDMSMADRKNLERRLDQRQAMIKRLAIRLKPKVRKDAMERHGGAKKK